MTRPKPPDEDEILVSAQSSATAFADFYESFERSVLRFFLHATRRPEVAADLTAETFTRALESIASYDASRGHAHQWLFGIARNVLAESYRRGRVDDAARVRLGLPVLVLDDHAAESIARLSAGSDETSQALAGLPIEQREAIEARVVLEREYGEIAQELDCSEALVRQRVSRGLRALRIRLAGER